MRKLFLITAFLFSINAQAQTTCPYDPSVRWHNCVGTFSYADGAKYVGAFKDDKRHGQGTYTWPDGERYVGAWKDDSMHGQGTYTYASGDQYVGEYKDSEMNGQGTFTWADGERYVGAWKDNKRHGQGAYTYANGAIDRGYYMNGEYVPTICENMGLTEGTESFGNCVVELIKQINESDIQADISENDNNSNTLEILNEIPDAINTFELNGYIYGSLFALIFILYLLYFFTKNKEKSKNEIRALSKTKVLFKGNVRDYYSIWITNILLMVITLGIYSPWAKVRNMKYFYQNTFIDGHNFDYTAKPIQILKGRIIAVTVLLLYSLLVSIFNFFSIILPIAIVFLTPWLINQSMRFNMRVTSYRNIKFNFLGSYFESFTRFILYPIVVVLTLYIAAPRVHKSINNYIINNTEFGSKKFITDQKTSAYYNALSLSGLFIVLMIICMYFVAYILGINNGETLAIISVGLYIALFVSAPIYQSQIRNSIYNNSCIDKTVYFKSSLTARGYTFLVITNVLLVIVTLGLAIPWVKIRNAKYFAHLTNVYFDTGVDSIIQQETKDGSVLADEIGDAFDIDVSLG